MPELLYLDTARLGQMSSRACRASVDFARFASGHGSSLYLTDFLRHGFGALPPAICDRYPGLADWSGVATLKDSLRRLSRSHADADVMLASRSASLMKFAAGLLVRPCRNIFITDLCWPAYERILSRALRNSACTLTKVKLRRSILRRQLSGQELIDHLANQFAEHRCDGLFLPLVDNLGIQLPVRQIVERLRAEGELRFVVVDGAQAIHHVPLDLAADYCDFLVAGCHKWLRAFTPLGLGFFGHPRSADYVRDSLRRSMKHGHVDDPLLAFTDALQSGREQLFGETVAVSPMIAANGAVMDALDRPDHDEESLSWNRDFLAATAAAGKWCGCSPHDDFASRILLYQSRSDRDRSASPDELRRRLLASHVAATAYHRGIVRVSLPDVRFTAAQQSVLRAAFAGSLPRHFRMSAVVAR